MGKRRDRLDALVAEHGRTFATEAGLLLRDTPSPLFRLLVLARLMAADVPADLGVRAATDKERWQVLADAGYPRKRRTARHLGALAEEILSSYGGDLRRLRDEADGEPERIHDELRGLTGIGAVSADAFCREAQAVWPSLRPWLDARTAKQAKRLKLPTTPGKMATLVGSADLAVVGAALVRSRQAR